jgi:hypothetical protein
VRETARLTRVERFLTHLDGLSGGVEPSFWPVESTKPGIKGLTAIGYKDTPEPGLFLGVTYGLSLAEHKDWRYGKPELCVCVRSDSPTWLLAMATLAEQLRGECPFRYGDTLNFGEPISEESQLDGFVVFAPSVLDKDEAKVDVGDALPIHIVGTYPTYFRERTFIQQNGLEAFWGLRWDPYDVTRPSAVP